MNYAFLKTATTIVHGIGADHVIGRRYKGVGSIFMAHSVVPDRQSLVDPQLQTCVSFLDDMLAYYTTRGVDVLSLDQALAALQSAAPRPFVCFTFDDGYKSNLTLALPVFEKYGKPFTVYVTSAFIKRTMNHRRGLLREVVARASRIRFGQDEREIDIATPQRKRHAFKRLADRLNGGSLPGDAVDRVAAEYGLSAASVLDADALTVEELRTLAQSTLVEIGGHTANHTNLSRLSESEAREEMLRNKTFLEGIIGREVRHFAYPYGDAASCGHREFDLCQGLGFHSATTTRFGGLFTDHLNAPTALPRIRFNGECESLGFMECQRNGAVTALITRFGPSFVTA